MAIVSMNYLLEAGAHFGHQTKRWNPKMKEYIFTTRDDIYIIDLQKTVKKMEEAYTVLSEIASNGGKVLYVGTKKQASEVVREEATRSNMFYVSERWLGGTLTNFGTIRKRVNRMIEIEKMETDGTFDVLPKKEVIGIKKEYEKLDKYLSGIKTMTRLPQAIIIVDTKKEYNAIREARKLNIPIFGLIDTNCDPDLVDYVLPANDDAVRSIKVVLGAITNAIVAANGGDVIDYVSEDEKKDTSRFDNRKDFKRPDYKEEKSAPRVTETKREVEEEKQPEVKEVKIEKEVEEKQPEVKETKIDLSALTVKELRDLAKDKGVKGYSTLKKEELLDNLK